MCMCMCEERGWCSPHEDMGMATSSLEEMGMATTPSQEMEMVTTRLKGVKMPKPLSITPLSLDMCVCVERERERGIEREVLSFPRDGDGHLSLKGVGMATSTLKETGLATTRFRAMGMPTPFSSLSLPLSVHMIIYACACV